MAEAIARTAAPTDASAARQPRAPTTPNAAMSPERLREAAQGFEAFYLARALEPMFEGIKSEPPFGGGMAEDVWRSLLIDEYGKAIAKAGGIGIADAVVRELITVQERAGAAPAAAASGSSKTTTRLETKQP